ncbi:MULTISPECIES: serine kinase [Rhodanobacter]|uniref:serine kinase n=1 Tax=Rhodanobacter TaxID=75309 RepID=UPI0004122FD7|nr:MULTISPECIES: serine kinase [Rhodanobacter]TAN19579.1 MAG: serine kinase [Rhodanobacter sp.]UJJ54930.1 serine kinase [Rhodanobacter thiooxydans]
MTLNPHHDAWDAASDPFGERPRRQVSLCRQIMGGNFRFESASAALLSLVETAYAGLPPHRFPMAVPEFRIELRLLPRRAAPPVAEPPPVQMQSGAGLICGVMDASNYVVLAPAQRQALVVASADMLDRPYHLRYELIEFAVFTLATRGLGLVPLHAACVGRQGRGILLLGASGTGKSTLALHSLLHGLDFLAEDAVFVQPDSLLATGVANYLHVRADALRRVDDAEVRRWIGAAPVIRRRSGVEKFEADLRHGGGRLAPTPLALAGAVFVCGETADDPAALLEAVPAAEIAARLCADQPYACGQPGWQHFARRLARQGVHQLRRGRHPRDAVTALCRLLD